jgi:predicted aldo/keto reductase-like oxidoreductase
MLGRTGLKVRAVGFGGIPIQRVSEEEAVRVVRRCYKLGINYYDTARGYTVSEERIGKALEDVRKEVVLATKTHALTKEAALTDLEISLKNLKTDHIDLYQLHAVSSDEEWEKISAPGGALEALYLARDTGKADHIGITSHNIRLLDRIVRENIFETVLIQYNYLSRQPAEDFLRLCRGRDVGTIIMKPFGGGAFNNANTALKFVLSNDDVDVVIPGMAAVSEVEENVAMTSGTYTLTDEELRLIEKDKVELGDQFCRGCDYCQPCPQEVPISSILRVESLVKRMGRISRVEKMLRDRMEESTKCVECGTCETRCPYQLPIRELLKEKRKYIVSTLNG